jgi:hypothetical protein
MPYVVKLLEIANNMAEIEWDITDCKKRYKMRSRNSNYQQLPQASVLFQQS